MLPDMVRTLRLGACNRCPSCGQAPLLHRYLKVIPECSACGERFEHYRADDLPAYLTIAITGHILIVFIMMAEEYLNPGAAAFFVYPLAALALVLGLLPRIKGMVLAWMWCLYRDNEQAEC